MKDWKIYQKDLYRSIVDHCQRGADYERKIWQRIYDNRNGIYETPKVFKDGYACNDGSWLIYTTSRMVKNQDATIYKDKVFCEDKHKLIENLYSYILFLRKIGIECVWEMKYYAVSFMVKYLRFYDKVYSCNMENQKLIIKLCQSAFKKEPDEIDCSTRIDTRNYAIDPNYVKRMNSREKNQFRKSTQRKITNERIQALYDPSLTNAQNLKVFKEHGLDIKERRLQEWKYENRGGALLIPKSSFSVVKMPSNNDLENTNSVDIQLVNGCAIDI